jgi:hypothetical protein
MNWPQFFEHLAVAGGIGWGLATVAGYLAAHFDRDPDWFEEEEAERDLTNRMAVGDEWIP